MITFIVQFTPVGNNIKLLELILHVNVRHLTLKMVLKKEFRQFSYGQSDLWSTTSSSHSLFALQIIITTVETHIKS